MKLNRRELAAVLHGLRETQRQILNGIKLDGLLHFEGIKALTLEEIDRLCERLNTDPKPRKR